MTRQFPTFILLALILIACRTAAPANDRSAFDVSPAPISDFLYDPAQNSITVYGDLVDGCTQFESISGQHDGKSITIDVLVRRERNRDCIQAMEPFEATYQLNDDVQSGTYTVRVNDLSRDVTVAR